MKKFAFIFFALFSLAAYSAEIKVAYICATEASTGFLYSQGKWNVSQFTEKDFLIRKLRENDPGFNNSNKTPYGVFELDEKVPAMFCSIRDQSLECSGLGRLDFLSETGRFLRTYTNGYIGGDEYTAAQPKIMLGTCKPLPAGYKELPKKVYPPSL